MLWLLEPGTNVLWPETPPWPCRPVCWSSSFGALPFVSSSCVKWALGKLCVLLWDCLPAVMNLAPKDQNKTHWERGMMGKSSLPLRCVCVLAAEKETWIQSEPSQRPAWFIGAVADRRREIWQNRDARFQIWRPPVAATGWFDWCGWSSLTHFLNSSNSRGVSATCLCDISRCVFAAVIKENRSLSSCSYCSIEERIFFLSEEKQSLCCFCRVSRFQIRCRSWGK